MDQNTLKAGLRYLFEQYIEAFSQEALKEHCQLSTPSFHQEIFDVVTGNDKRIAIAAPRGFAKSTAVSLVYALWAALTGKARFIIICSDTYSQAKLFVDSIKRELESNPKILWAYGKQQTDKWSEGEIELSNGCKIMAKGQGQKMRGLKHINTRPDLVILDDLENNELVESSERREKLERWFFAEVLPSLDQEGKVVYVGTIIHEDSLLNKVITKYGNWKILFYTAADKDFTKSLWEERMSIQKILELKEEYAKNGLLPDFYAEYMNNPMSDETREFKRQWFKYYRDDELPGNLKVFTTVDLAISEKDTACDSVVMSVGVGADNMKYILKYSYGKMNPTEVIEKIFDHYELFNSEIVGIEAVAYQQSLIHFLRKEMLRRNKVFRVKEIRTWKEKEAKIRGLIPFYEMGAIYHRFGMSAALEDQLLSFPRGSKVDIIDALAMEMELWANPLMHGPTVPKRTGKTIEQLMKEDGLSVMQRS